MAFEGRNAISGKIKKKLFLTVVVAVEMLSTADMSVRNRPRALRGGAEPPAYRRACAPRRLRGC
eukprot:2549845-Heterocapsa_arctica.AAC.1